jgi:crotonobetainyl-CoA:carnitine CoA-transferase CaiB-like acyl-CoA transferase
VLGRPELADDPRFVTNGDRVRNRDALVPLIEQVFASRPAAEWLAALDAAQVPCAPIRSMDEVFAAPEGAALVDDVADAMHGEILKLVTNPIRLDGERTPTRLAPPTLAAHDAEGWLASER